MLDTCSLRSPWTCMCREGFYIWFSFLSNKRKTLTRAVIKDLSSDEFVDLCGNRQNIFSIIAIGFGTSTCRCRKQWVLTKWKAYFLQRSRPSTGFLDVSSVHKIPVFFYIREHSKTSFCQKGFHKIETIFLLL